MRNLNFAEAIGIVTILTVIFITFFLGPEIVGYSVLHLNKQFNETTTFLLVNQSGSLKSLKIHGSMFGNGTLEVYLFSANNTVLLANITSTGYEKIKIKCKNECPFYAENNASLIFKIVNTTQDFFVFLKRVNYAFEPAEEKLKIVDQNNNTISYEAYINSTKIDLNLLPEGNYDVDIVLNNSKIKKLSFKDLYVTSNLVLEIGSVNFSNKNFVDGFYIDLRSLNFTNVTVFVNASGVVLEKCESWNYTAKRCIVDVCNDNDEDAGLCKQKSPWRFISLESNSTYKFILTPLDPGFGEFTVNISQDENFTNSTDWQNKTLLNFNTRNAGYLLFAYAELQQDSSAERASSRFLVDGQGRARIRFKPDQGRADGIGDYEQFFTHYIRTYSQVEHQAAIQYKTTAGGITFIRNSKIIATFVPDWQRNYTSLQQLPNHFVNLTTLTINSTGKPYLFLITSEVSANSTTESIFARAKFDDQIISNISIEGEAANDIDAFGTHFVKNITGTHAITLEASSELSNYAYARRNRISAIELAKYFYNESLALASTTSSARKLSLHIGDAGDYIIIASADVWINDSTGGNYLWVELKLDNKTVARLVKGLSDDSDRFNFFAVHKENVSNSIAEIYFGVYGNATVFIENTRISAFPVGNTPPTTPTSITCNNESCYGIFYDNISISCSGSMDYENDIIYYWVEAWYKNSSMENASWHYIGNHSQGSSLLWDFYGKIPEQENVKLRCKAYDPYGSNSFSGYLEEGNLSLRISDRTPPNITMIADFPDPVDQGDNITFIADVYDNKQLSNVWLMLLGKNYSMEPPGIKFADILASNGSIQDFGAGHNVEGGDYADTFYNDNDYYYVGRSNGFSLTSLQSYITLEYNLSNLNISWQDVNWINVSLTYCHSGNAANPACDQGIGPGGTPLSLQNVEVYNFTAQQWQAIGNLTLGTSDEEINDSWLLDYGFEDFIVNNTILLRFQVNYFVFFFSDVVFLVDKASIGINYTYGYWSYSHNTSLLKQGVYNYTIFANDTSANLAWKEGNFSVIAYPPAVKIITPENGSRFAQFSTIEISTIAKDTNLDTVLANVTYPNNITKTFLMKNDEYSASNRTVLLLHLNNNSLLGENLTFIYDSSNYRNHGYCNESFCPYVAEGKFGLARYFNASMGIYIKNNESLNFENEFTLEAWINISSFSVYDALIVKPWNTSGAPYVSYGLGLGNDNNFYVRFTTNVSSYTCFSAPGSAELNTWTHVAAVFNKSYVQLYVNGKKSGEPCDFSGVILNTGMPLWIGYYPWDSAYNFNGTIDELRISNFARTDFSPDYYKIKFNDTSLVGWYNTRIIANDNLANVNNSESVYFEIFTINLPPYNVTLYKPDNSAVIYERKPLFQWYNTSDPENDSFYYRIVVSNSSSFDYLLVNDTNISLGGIVNYTPAEPLPTDVWIYWKVLACDNYSCSTSEIWNFTIQSIIMISMPVKQVDFGTMKPGQEENTTDNNPLPLLVQNDGNLLVDVQINGTDLWETVSNPTPYYQYKIGVNESDSFDEANSTMQWRDMPTMLAIVDIASLNYEDWHDNAEIELKIKVPDDEPAGVKNSTILVSAEVSE